MALSVSLALATVIFVLALAVRCGVPLSHVVSHQSDEIVLLTIFGTALLVARAAQRLKVRTAIWAFLVGIAVSDPLLNKHIVCSRPFRDPFAATFFSFFWPSNRPSNPAVPSGVRRFAGRHNRCDKSAERFLGCVANLC